METVATGLGHDARPYGFKHLMQKIRKGSVALLALEGVVFMIDDLIGIPFVNGGRTRSGCDCWGLTVLVFKEFGIDLPDYRISCFASDLIDGQISKERCQWKRINKPEPPCLVTLRIDPEAPGLVTHLGVCVGENKFMHTMIKRNSVIERMDHPYFKNRIEGFYAYAG